MTTLSGLVRVGWQLALRDEEAAPKCQYWGAWPDGIKLADGILALLA